MKIYSLDENKISPYPNKASILKAIIFENSLEQNKTIYVGDRGEDQDAALESGVSFIHSSWGYGSLSNLNSENSVSAKSAQDLYEKISSR